MSSLPPPPPGPPPPQDPSGSSPHGQPGSLPPPPPVTPANIPPGYTPYQQRGLLTGGGERVVGLAKAIQILIGIELVISVVSLVVLMSNRSRFRDYLNDIGSKDDAQAAINAIAAVGSIASAAQLAAAVCTMIWMWRAARNVQLAGRPDQTWGPGWGVGGWFCPPCIFVIPWLMLTELWKGSDPSTAPGDPSWKRNPGWSLITVWWVLFGLSGIILLVLQLSSGAFSQDVDDLADFYESAIGWNVLSTAATIAAGICFIVIVRKLTDRQRQLTGQ